MKRPSNPHLVIISDSIRRDLQAPLGLFKKVRITHLYRRANYRDMTPADFRIVKTLPYHSPMDLWRRLKYLNPDIIQGIEPFSGKRAMILSFVVWLYSVLVAKPYFFPVLENRPIGAKFNPLMAKIVHWWAAVYGRQAVRVLYLNDGAKRNLVEVGIPVDKLERKLWGNWGIDTREFRPLKLHKTRKLQKPVVLFVGKISEAKGVPWLLKAMEEVVKKVPKAGLWLAGPIDPNYQLSIINYPFAKYLGIVKNKKIAAIFRKAAVAAAPSITTKTWEEQVGNVILQAMSCGVPVVATCSGAIPEYVKDGHGVILVPEKDSLALAVAISRLLENKKIREYQSQLAKKWIVEHCEVRKNIKALDKWLETLARSNK